MQKDINQVILGAERNTTKWKKANENIPAVKLVIEKENNIYIRGVRLLKYSMAPF
jgi:hypothetical protein